MSLRANNPDCLLIDGMRLEMAWYGPSPEDAPTLVFLHEGLGCVSMWRDFPSDLAKATGCGALVYSRLGYGKSDPCPLPRPINFMHEEGLESLPKVLDVAGIRDFILIGHSDGGSIAIIYGGGMKSIPLRGLITEAAHVFCEDISVKSIRHAREMYLEGDLRRKLERHHGRNTDCAFWGWNDVWLHPAFRHWNIEEYLPRLQVPMLVIQGKDDIYGTSAQVESISRRVHTEVNTLMLTNCGHSPHLDRKKTVLSAMVRFVSSLFP